jgi:hypothetical protein
VGNLENYPLGKKVLENSETKSDSNLNLYAKKMKLLIIENSHKNTLKATIKRRRSKTL